MHAANPASACLSYRQQQCGLRRTRRMRLPQGSTSTMQSSVPRSCCRPVFERRQLSQQPHRQGCGRQHGLRRLAQTSSHGGAKEGYNPGEKKLCENCGFNIPHPSFQRNCCSVCAGRKIRALPPTKTKETARPKPRRFRENKPAAALIAALHCAVHSAACASGWNSTHASPARAQ